MIIDAIYQHPQYDKDELNLELVRDCIEGEAKIKDEGRKYLPHPSTIDKDSPFAKERYKEFLYGAEFDDFPNLTRLTMLGKIPISRVEPEIPAQMDYLISDADGDGTSFTESMAKAADNVLQFKWHVLVADFEGLSDIPIQSVSMDDFENAGLRANIKQYSRNNVINWNHRMVNGVKQLSFIMLREVGTLFDQENFQHEPVDSYLILALDEEGNYYQQKIVAVGEDGGYEKGERSYVTIGDEPVKFLPVEIVCDEPIKDDQMPQGMGYLYPICTTALYRYRVSALYKETMRYLAPTIFTKGWTQVDKQLFKDVNGNRQGILMGGGVVNNLPNNVDWGVVSADTDLGGYERYFEANEDKVRALGGVFSSKDNPNATATEAEIDAHNQNAILNNICDSLESSYRRCVGYCAVLQGLVSQDEIMGFVEAITLEIGRDFATPKLTVEEVDRLLSMVGAGVKTREQVAYMLANGGWDYQEAETTISELESAPPRPTSLVNQS